MDTNSASTNLNLECNGIPWIVGKCKNIPRICARCSSLCNRIEQSSPPIYLGEYPLSCGFSEGCFQFMFIRLNSTYSEVISNFISTEPVAVTATSISISMTLSGPASVMCSAYLDVVDPINPYSVSNRNTTNSVNMSSITINRYDDPILFS